LDVNNEWYYFVIDIIVFLTEQEDVQTARKYGISSAKD